MVINQILYQITKTVKSLPLLFVADKIYTQVANEETLNTEILYK
jgi:hypothetical protein